jgi:hypothetical protein
MEKVDQMVKVNQMENLHSQSLEKENQKINKVKKAKTAKMAKRN